MEAFHLESFSDVDDKGNIPRRNASALVNSIYFRWVNSLVFEFPSDFNVKKYVPLGKESNTKSALLSPLRNFW